VNILAKVCQLFWGKLVCPGKRKKGMTPEDFSERSEGQDGKEAEQELQHQYRRDLQHAEDFAGDVLQVSEDRGVMVMELYTNIW